MLDEADELCARSRDLAPNNPVVLAVASLTASWRAMRWGRWNWRRRPAAPIPDNELACHALSQALTDCGRDAEGSRPMSAAFAARWPSLARPAG